jgi:hypothetical protein
VQDAAGTGRYAFPPVLLKTSPSFFSPLDEENLSFVHVHQGLKENLKLFNEAIT